MQTVRFEDLGRLSFQEAWDYQTCLHRMLVDNKLKNRQQPAGSYTQEHAFLLVEHPHVYTLGKSGSLENLLLSAQELHTRQIDYFPINRGGDITYHGPGQVVGYPILDLECFFTDVHRYVRNIEEVIIRTLADFDVEAIRIKDYTGVWCPPKTGAKVPTGETNFWNKYRKICAIGVHLSRWVTLHGFALNVDTDLNYFNFIVPCGIADADKTVSSIAREVGRQVPMRAVQEKLKVHFCEVFQCKLSE
ncbi:MAG: lipoyl(octanoyl) transferase LipB [Saprospiraceae bacterium]